MKASPQFKRLVVCTDGTWNDLVGELLGADGAQGPRTAA